MIAKVKFAIVFTLILTTLLFGYGSYKFYGENVKLQDQYSDLVEINKKQKEEIDQLLKSAKIDDKYVLESLETNKNLSDVEQSTLIKIERLKHPSVAPSEVKKSEEITVSIDDKLPDDLSTLLREHFNSLQRQSDSVNTSR